MTIDNDAISVFNALHIMLVCWEGRHVQAISAEQLRLLKSLPLCTARVGSSICGSSIWAVRHDGEPVHYVGKTPRHNWEQWADCVGSNRDC